MVVGVGPSAAAVVRRVRHAKLVDDRQKNVLGARPAAKEREAVPRTVAPVPLSYENHINTESAKVEWTIEEELLLIQIHNDIGNKWSVIAQKIPGKYHRPHTGPIIASKITSTPN